MVTRLKSIFLWICRQFGGGGEIPVEYSLFDIYYFVKYTVLWIFIIRPVLPGLCTGPPWW